MLGNYVLITDGNPKNTKLINPNGIEVWGIKEIQVRISSSTYFAAQVIVKRYLPYMWADFTSSTGPISFATVKDPKGNPVILEEHLTNVEIKSA